MNLRLALLALLSSQLAWAGVRTEVLQLQSTYNGGSSVNCSSTLLKMGDECALVSNTHCAPDFTDLRVVLRVQPHSQPVFLNRNVALAIHQPAGATEVEVKVRARSALLDVVRLELPESLQAECAALDPENAKPVLQDLIVGPRVRSYATSGFVHGGFVSYFSNEIPWSMGNGYSDIELATRGPGDKNVFYELDELRIIPGMSGGPVYTNWGEFAGINSELALTQSKAWVVPAAILWDFLHGLLPSDAPARPWDPSILLPKSGSNSTAPGSEAGNNGHGGGGETGNNGHGGGGDGGGTKRPQTPAPSLLQGFREPDEGVVLPGGSNLILLAAGGRQINGTDDYATFFAPFADKLKASDLVVRPKDGYPDQKTRSKILERLAGFYGPPYRNGPGGFSGGMQKNQHAIYTKLPDSNESWLPALKGESMAEVDVNAKESRITLYLYMHDIGIPGLPSMLHIPERFETFQVRMNEDATEVYLIHPKLTLKCDNHNYLKLICSGDGVEFSISGDRLKGKDVSYRLSFLAVNKDRSLGAEYFYGIVREIEKPKDRREMAEYWRKLDEKRKGAGK